MVTTAMALPSGTAADPPPAVHLDRRPVGPRAVVGRPGRDHPWCPGSRDRRTGPPLDPPPPVGGRAWLAGAEREQGTRCHRLVRIVEVGRRHDAARAGQVYLTLPRPQTSPTGALVSAARGAARCSRRPCSAGPMILPTMPLRARPVAALVALALAAPPTATPHEPLPAAPVPRSVGWVRPVQPGPVVAPFDPPEQDWLAGHRGVDLAAAVGEVVRAPADGEGRGARRPRHHARRRAADVSRTRRRDRGARGDGRRWRARRDAVSRAGALRTRVLPALGRARR